MLFCFFGSSGTLLLSGMCAELLMGFFNLSVIQLPRNEYIKKKLPRNESNSFGYLVFLSFLSLNWGTNKSYVNILCFEIVGTKPPFRSYSY